MEKSRIDAAQFLFSGEKILLKAHAQKSKTTYVETAFCLLFWFLTVAGDCFIVGYANQIKTLVNSTGWFLPFFIALVFLHLVPLGMWVISLSSKTIANSEKWFFLTDKRIISVAGGKPSRAEFIDLKDVVSVKTAKKYITLGLEGGRYYKIAKIAEISEFSKLLEGVLDKIFDSGTETPEAEPEKEVLNNAETENKVAPQETIKQAENASEENINNADNIDNIDNKENQTEKND